MKKKVLLIGSLLAVLVVAAVAVGGVVRAQTATPSPGQSGGAAQAPANGAGAGAQQQIDSFLNALAQNLGISRSALDNGLKTTAQQQVAQAVSAGKLTQQQADKIDQRVQSGQFPFGAFLGRGRGAGGNGQHTQNGHNGQNGQNGAAVRACLGSAQQAAASTLGISLSDLQQARQGGESLSQIAQDHGTTVQALQSAIGDAVKSCLDQQVQAGTITSGQEQSLIQRLQNRLGAQPAGRHGGAKSGNSQ
jgi:hypothetical protein